MKKLLLTLVGIMLALNLNAQTGVAPSGDGSSGNPYEIATWENLYWLSQNSGEWANHFIQTADIDFNDASPAITTWDSNQGWTPIGNNTTKFTGTYNGKGHVINGLYIDRSSTAFISLFGYMEGSNARVDSLGVTNADFTGFNYVAGLVGYNNNGVRIIKSYSTGSVSGNLFVGGLIGQHNNASIVEDCYSTANVSGNAIVGGLVGQNVTSTVNKTYATGSVSGGLPFGGLVGNNNLGIVSNSFWDTETSGQSGSDGGTGKNTAQMQTQSTFTSAGWDFTNTWRIDDVINNGYPYHSFNNSLLFEPDGEGTESNPYQIANWQNLYWLSQNSGEWTKHFIQTADIDFNDAAPAITTWDGNKGWAPIGNGTTKFTGTYNGQGHVINGLFIDRSSTDNIGLFGYVTGASIDSLGVTNADVTGTSSVGVIVGHNYIGATVSECYSTGSVSGTHFVGGLVGYSYSSTVENCYSAGDVSGSGNYAGGLVGNITSSTVENCYSAGNVSATSHAGGLVGNNDGGTVTNSFWDTQTSGQNSSDGGTGKNTAQMQTQATFTDAGWDFVGESANGNDDIWGFNSAITGYPFLAWQNSMSQTIPAGNTDEQSFEAAGASVQFTVGNAGPIQLNIVRTDAEPNVFGSLPGSVQNLSPRYWSATVTSGSADGTYDITFDITGLDGVVDCYTLKVLKRNNDASAWQDVETLGGVMDYSGCPNTIVARGLTGFSDFVIGGGSDNPLPVELAEFSGESTSNGIELRWATHSETNNEGFALLRNGAEIADYTNSEALKGHGSTLNRQTYAYIDGDVSLNETYTYELVSVDYSGVRHSYEKTVEVKAVEASATGQPEEYGLAQNYPNPFNPSTTIKYTMKEAGVATLKVFDMLGRVVLSESIEAKIGQNVYNFNGQNYSSGVYFYQLNAEGFSKTLKMMLVK